MGDLFPVEEEEEEGLFWWCPLRSPLTLPPLRCWNGEGIPESSTSTRKSCTTNASYTAQTPITVMP